MDCGNGALTSPVHVIDDDDSFRISIVRMLLAAGLPASGYRCAGEFLIAQGAAIRGCILLDISMPGPSGLDLMKALAARDCAPAVIFVTAFDDLPTTVDMMKLGAIDYLIKPVPFEMTISAVLRALDVDARRRAARQELQELRSRFESLTPTERTIFRGIVYNRLNKQLAADLDASERTIKAKRAQLFRKLHVTNIPALVRMAKLLEDAGCIASPERRPCARPGRNALGPSLPAHCLSSWVSGERL
jgi:FixJ family two-component response regulator